MYLYTVCGVCVYITLSADDLGHVFGTGHRHAFGHVLALLVPRFFREPVGYVALCQRRRRRRGRVHHGLSAGQRRRRVRLVLLLSLFAVHVQHAEFQGHLQGARVFDHLVAVMAGREFQVGKQRGRHDERRRGRWVLEKTKFLR